MAKKKYGNHSIYLGKNPAASEALYDHLKAIAAEVGALDAYHNEPSVSVLMQKIAKGELIVKPPQKGD
jgi:hypothetical protein